MELLELAPYFLVIILILFIAWETLDLVLSYLKERRQKQDAPAKPEDELPTISYVQPGDGGPNIPMQ